MRTRQLVPDDAAPYRRLALDGYRAHPDAFTSTVDERADLPLDWWRARIDRHFVVGAWSEGALVGAAGLEVEARPKTRHKALLFGMIVAPGHARRGIGSRLVDAVLDHATRSALRVVQLTVSEGNVAAQALYERHGFTTFGVEPFGIRGVDGYVRKVHLWIDLATRSAAARAGELVDA